MFLANFGPLRVTFNVINLVTLESQGIQKFQKVKFRIDSKLFFKLDKTAAGSRKEW